MRTLRRKGGSRRPGSRRACCRRSSVQYSMTISKLRVSPSYITSWSLHPRNNTRRGKHKVTQTLTVQGFQEAKRKPRSAPLVHPNMLDEGRKHLIAGDGLETPRLSREMEQTRGHRPGGHSMSANLKDSGSTRTPIRTHSRLCSSLKDEHMVEIASIFRHQRTRQCWGAKEP